MNEDAVDYIIKAVAMVAREGWKLLPQVCRIYNSCDVVFISHVYRATMHGFVILFVYHRISTFRNILSGIVCHACFSLKVRHV